MPVVEDLMFETVKCNTPQQVTVPVKKPKPSRIVEDYKKNDITRHHLKGTSSKFIGEPEKIAFKTYFVTSQVKNKVYKRKSNLVPEEY